MLDEANSKRRKLDREKRVFDRPKEGDSYPLTLAHSANATATAGLGSLLAPRPPPTVPLQFRRRLGFDGQPLMEPEITWALRHPDLRADATVSALEDDEAWHDMERMGVSQFPCL